MPEPRRDRLAALFGALSLALANSSAADAAMPRNPWNSAAPAPFEITDSGQGGTASDASATPVQTYADLVDLALVSRVVATATIRRQTRLKPDEAPGVAPGYARLYIEADMSALMVGPELGESLRFLADVPLDAKGKPPKLNKTQVLLFGTTVPNKPGELLLVASDTMFAWSPELENRVRAILTELVSPDAPPRITGLREALHVPGNLVGEGETQFFFATDNGKPVSISVLRRPGIAPHWGVSFSEIVDQSAMPPKPETLAWYRLACTLPSAIPDRAQLSTTATDRRIATEDYAMVLASLGPCLRNRTVIH